MVAEARENGSQKPQGAHSGLTNAPTSYTLLLSENIRANRAECATTPHGSDPTLIQPVTGLHSIIANRGTFVLRGFGGPTDSHVGLGRFVVQTAGGV